MGWITLYIRGKEGFQEEVLEILNESKLEIMPGSLGDDASSALFWINQKTPLHEIKKAIGSKVIFKYRLQFSFDLQDSQTKDKTEKFTAKEKAMIRKMHDWEERMKYKHSA